MKILDEWKVYAGTSDLRQTKEGILVSEVIINANYSDDHDDYDIALVKLSQPLVLSGEVLECLLSSSAQMLVGPFFFCPRKGSLACPSFPAQVRPACLPMSGQRFLPGRACFITGFGKISENEGKMGEWTSFARLWHRKGELSPHWTSSSLGSHLPICFRSGVGTP